MKFKEGCYYRDIITGQVYLVQITEKHQQVALLCFQKAGTESVIVPASSLSPIYTEEYATSFVKAFERYWNENKKNLIYINKLEISNYVKPKRRYRKGVGRAF